MFPGTSNLRSLQATYMKFAEHVDIWVQIIYAKFKNDRAKDNGDTRCMKMEKNSFSKKDLNSLYFIVVLQYNVPILT